MATTQTFSLRADITADSACNLIRAMERALEPQSQPQTVRVEIDSEGGDTRLGIILYEYFRLYPLKLEVVNVGAVKSAAAIAFLGAPVRMMKKKTHFMFHPVGLGPCRAVYDASSPEEKGATKRNILSQQAIIDEICARHLTLAAEEEYGRNNFDCDILDGRAFTAGVVTSEDFAD